MKTLGKIIVWTIALAVYLNIGWAYGTYAHNHLRENQKQTTMIEKALTGPDRFLQISASADRTLLNDQLVDMFFWPLDFFVIILVWIIYGAYQLLWLVFAGGIAKLLGVGVLGAG